MPPGPSHRSPFDHYKQTAENAPQPDLHRFVLQRLGLTAEEFEDRVTREINEALREARAERNLDLLATPTSDTHEPLSRILTKEDCMTLFRATGVPLSSALGGVYRWAANLGVPRFKLMENLEPHELQPFDELY